MAPPDLSPKIEATIKLAKKLAKMLGEKNVHATLARS